MRRVSKQSRGLLRSVSAFASRTLGYGRYNDSQSTEEFTVGEKIDDAKGRAKEAAGDLTDDKDLKREGKVDRAASDVKEKVSDVSEKVKEKIGRDDD
jgi:uncharacterized protein YjbJ (UPF0337 family)